MIQSGASLVYVKEQMGHSSIQVTVEIYGHLIPGANVSFVDQLDDAPQDCAETTPHQSAPGTHRAKNDVESIPPELAGERPDKCYPSSRYILLPMSPGRT